MTPGQNANLGRRLAPSTISPAATSRARDLTPSAREHCGSESDNLLSAPQRLWESVHDSASPPLLPASPAFTLRCFLRAHRPQEPQTDASLEPAPGGSPPRLPGITSSTSSLVWLIRVEGSRGSGSAGSNNARGATARYHSMPRCIRFWRDDGDITEEAVGCRHGRL